MKYFATVLIIIAVLVITFTTLVFPQTERQIAIMQNALTDDFLVNEHATGDTTYQSKPSIATDGKGNFVIVWVDNRDSNNYDIYFQRYDSNGVAQGVNTKINNDIGAFGASTSIAMDTSGNFVIVWTDRRNGNWDIYFQRYNASGDPQGTNTKVNNDVGTAGQHNPSIAMNSGGIFVIVWDDERDDGGDIYFQRYNSIGIAQGVNTKVNNDVGTTGQGEPSIGMDENGNFVIAWVDYRNGKWDIYLQRYNSSGIAQFVNRKVNDEAGTAESWIPSIAMDGSGNFVVVWPDRRNYYHWDIYFQRYNSSGDPQGVNIKVNDDVGTTEQVNPSIAMNDNGNFEIVWQDYRYDSNNPDVIGQRYYTSGTAWGANYRVVADGPNHVEQTPVVVATVSQIVFAWVDNRRSEGWDIYGKIVGWDWDGVTSVSATDNVPLAYELKQNYPNPFNPETKISFSIPKRSFITLKVYDLLGREVTTLTQGEKEPGVSSVIWHAVDVPSGVYFYRLSTGDFVQTKKMVVMK